MASREEKARHLSCLVGSAAFKFEGVKKQKWLNKAIDEGPYKFKEFTPSESEPPRMQKENDLKGDDLKHYEAEIEAMNLILISIPNDIYNSVDACTTAQSINQAIVQADRVHIQGKNSGNDGRNTRHSNVQEEVIDEQMLLANQDEAGLILIDEHNDFLFADASRMEEIKELNLLGLTIPVQQRTHIMSRVRMLRIRTFSWAGNAMNLVFIQVK
nr:hypothetical protein [Tanacetum cinerariifolium]GEZ18964.1 hypothetical protein [Tanacetum cinerariifolium]